MNMRTSEASIYRSCLPSAPLVPAAVVAVAGDHTCGKIVSGTGIPGFRVSKRPIVSLSSLEYFPAVHDKRTAKGTMRARPRRNGRGVPASQRSLRTNHVEGRQHFSLLGYPAH